MVRMRIGPVLILANLWSPEKGGDDDAETNEAGDQAPLVALADS